MKDIKLAMTDANVEAVIAKLRQRAEVGLQKYGVTTEHLTLEDALQHWQEEAMDTAIYIEAALKARAEEE